MATKDTRAILDGRQSLRYMGVRYTPGMEDHLQAVLTPSELERLTEEGSLNGDGWEAGKTGEEKSAGTVSAQDARRQLDASRSAAAVANSSGSQMPYASLLIPTPFVNEDAVRQAADAEILAVRGIAGERLAEIREYFAE